MMLRGVEVRMGGIMEIIHWNDIYPGWSIWLFFGGWYTTIIITNWMILEYSHQETKKEAKTI